MHSGRCLEYEPCFIRREDETGLTRSGMHPQWGQGAAVSWLLQEAD